MKKMVFGALLFAFVFCLVTTSFAATPVYEKLILNDNPNWYFRFNETPEWAAANGNNALDSVSGTYNIGNYKHFGGDKYTVGLGTAGIPGGGAGNTASDYAGEAGGNQFYVGAGFSGGTFTQEVWIKTEDTAGTIMAITGANGITSQYSNVLHLIDGKVQHYVYAGGARYIPNLPGGEAANASNDGQWHHIAAIFDSNAGMRLYIDGVMTSSANGSWNPEAGTHWQMGSITGRNTTDWYKGSMDEMAFYDYALSSDKIWLHYRAGAIESQVVPKFWNPTVNLSLANILSGGNGLGTESGVQIDPRNGNLIANNGHINANVGTTDTFSTVDRPYVDGVLIPKSGGGTMTISSGGTTVATPNSDGRMWWTSIGIIDGNKGTWDQQGNLTSTFATPKTETTNYLSEGHSVIPMHSNTGITFDLETLRTDMRKTYGDDYTLDNFTTTLARCNKGGGTTEVNIYVDGVLQWKNGSFAGYNNNADNPNAYDIALGLSKDAKYLTIVTTDGTDGNDWDSVAFGDPTLMLGRNLALGKPVYASGSYDNTGRYGPSKITDGNVSEAALGSYWLAPEKTEGAFLIVDLEDTFLIDRIDLQNTKNAGHNDSATRHFSLDVSVDGIDWLTIAENELLLSLHAAAAADNNYPGGEYAVVPFQTYQFDEQWARYIRFTAEDYYGVRAGLNELRAYGSIPEPATWVMLLMGAGALCLLRRKAK